MSKTTLILTLRGTPPQIIEGPFRHHVMRAREGTEEAMRLVRQREGQIILYMNTRLEECFANGAFRYAGMRKFYHDPRDREQSIPLRSIPFNRADILPILRAWVPLDDPSVDLWVNPAGFRMAFTPEAEAQIDALYDGFFGIKR